MLLKTVPLFVRDSLMTSALKEFDYFEREKKKERNLQLRVKLSRNLHFSLKINEYKKKTRTFYVKMHKTSVAEIV